jgi:heme oxygenase
MTDQGTPIMQSLREATAAQHADAESRQLQRDLVAGRLPRATYAAWLGQMFLVHRALWEAIDGNREEHTELERIVRDEGRHVANLRSDLRALDIDADAVEPLASTARAVAEIRDVAANDPLTLLGYNYVLEGSMNGNRFIARAVAPTLDVPATAYLDPYGEEQRPGWLSYRERMNALEIEAAQADRMVRAAQAMFDFIAAMSDELVQKPTVSA